MMFKRFNFCFFYNCRLQTECGNYKLIAEEAYRQLILIQGKDFLSKSQDIRLKDWLDLMEEVCALQFILTLYILYSGITDASQMVKTEVE